MLPACVNHTCLLCDVVTRTEACFLFLIVLPSRCEIWAPSKSGYLLFLCRGIWESYKTLIAIEMPVDIGGQHK
jgi:hypothetical protein